MGRDSAGSRCSRMLCCKTSEKVALLGVDGCETDIVDVDFSALVWAVSRAIASWHVELNPLAVDVTAACFDFTDETRSYEVCLRARRLSAQIADEARKWLDDSSSSVRRFPVTFDSDTNTGKEEWRWRSGGFHGAESEIVLRM